MRVGAGLHQVKNPLAPGPTTGQVAAAVPPPCSPPLPVRPAIERGQKKERVGGTDPEEGGPQKQGIPGLISALGRRATEMRVRSAAFTRHPSPLVLLPRGRRRSSTSRHNSPETAANANLLQWGGPHLRMAMPAFRPKPTHRQRQVPCKGAGHSSPAESAPAPIHTTVAAVRPPPEGQS